MCEATLWASHNSIRFSLPVSMHQAGITGLSLDIYTNHERQMYEALTLVVDTLQY